MSEKINSEKSNVNVWKPILIAFSVCLIVWVGGMFLTHWYANKYFCVGKSDNAPALFGDSSGAVNALISALAFAGVIVSMYLQRKDLELQRQSLDVQQAELKQNTKELGLQRQEFVTQNKTLKIQRFETTFFNMLSLQQEIVNNLKFEYRKIQNLQAKEKVTGRQSFEIVFKKVLLHINPDISNQNKYEGLYKYIKAGGLIDYHQLQYIDIFDHYFSHLYRILKFIDETLLLDSYKERYQYTAILRATLSRYELILLFYNGLFFFN